MAEVIIKLTDLPNDDLDIEADYGDCDKANPTPAQAMGMEIMRAIAGALDEEAGTELVPTSKTFN
jgi:hypothetical protein